MWILSPEVSFRSFHFRCPSLMMTSNSYIVGHILWYVHVQVGEEGKASL